MRGLRTCLKRDVFLEKYALYLSFFYIIEFGFWIDWIATSKIVNYLLPALKEYFEKYLPCIAYLNIKLFGERGVKLRFYPYLALAAASIASVFTFNQIYFKVGAYRWQHTAIYAHLLGSALIYMATENILTTYYSTLLASVIYEAPWLSSNNRWMPLLLHPKTVVSLAYLAEKAAFKMKNLVPAAAALALCYVTWLLPNTLPLTRVTTRILAYIFILFLIKK